MTDAPLTDAVLIFNQQAGGTSTIALEEVQALLHQAGYQARYLETASEADLETVLAGVSGIVFVAGGDGTIRSASLRLAGRPGITLGIIPLGTANNIGHTLGIQGKPAEVIASYRGATAVPFDIGKVSGPWGQDLFLEACGCGAFAEVLAEYNPDEGKSPVRAVQALGSALSNFEPQPIVMRLDERSIEDHQPYALLEVMNTRATGPRLRLATHADPSDGLLDVIRINADERDGMLAYLSALARDDFEALPSVQSRKARVVELPYVGQAFHVDGEVRPPQESGGVVRFEVWPAALQVLAPVTEGATGEE